LQQRDPNEPNAFRLQNYPGMRRISKANLETIALQGQGEPMTSFYLSESKINKQFVDQLYSLVPPDKDTAENLPLIMEFKPDLSFYVIKNVSVKRLFKEDFDKMKATRLFREDAGSRTFSDQRKEARDYHFRNHRPYFRYGFIYRLDRDYQPRRSKTLVHRTAYELAGSGDPWPTDQNG